jgi:hypothetical protein
VNTHRHGLDASTGTLPATILRPSAWRLITDAANKRSRRPVLQVPVDPLCLVQRPRASTLASLLPCFSRSASMP